MSAAFQQSSQDTYTVVIEDTAETFSCLYYESILRAMERLNRKGIPVGCRGGGCGVCKIQVTAGCYRTGRLSREHVSAEEEAAGITLACRTEPNTDLRLRVLGTMRDAVMR